MEDSVCFCRVVGDLSYSVLLLALLVCGFLVGALVGTHLSHHKLWKTWWHGVLVLAATACPQAKCGVERGASVQRVLLDSCVQSSQLSTSLFLAFDWEREHWPTCSFVYVCIFLPSVSPAFCLCFSHTLTAVLNLLNFYPVWYKNFCCCSSDKTARFSACAKTKTDTGVRSLDVTEPKIWNNLQSDVTSAATVTLWK